MLAAHPGAAAGTRPSATQQWRDAGRDTALEAAKACRRCRRLYEWQALAGGEMAETIVARQFQTTAWASGLTVFCVLFLVPLYSHLPWVAVAFVPRVVLSGVGLWMRGAADLGRGLVVGAVFAVLCVLGMTLIGLAEYGS